MQRYMTSNKNLIIDDSDKRHIINVMRMNVNELFQIVCDEVLYTAKITSISKKDVSYEIIKEEKLINNKNYKIVFGISLIKEQKMDLVLQKMTELGVDEIIPVITERTVINPKENKLERWERILKESSEQSHRISIPKLHNILKLDDVLKMNFDVKLVCDTNNVSKNIKKVMQENKNSDTIIMMVGPEGGFTDNEIKKMNENGYISITLGNNILRAETVPIYLLSVINYEKE